MSEGTINPSVGSAVSSWFQRQSGAMETKRKQVVAASLKRSREQLEQCLEQASGSQCRSKSSDEPSGSNGH